VLLSPGRGDLRLTPGRGDLQVLFHLWDITSPGAVMTLLLKFAPSYVRLHTCLPTLAYRIYFECPSSIECPSSERSYAFHSYINYKERI